MYPLPNETINDEIMRLKQECPNMTYADIADEINKHYGDYMEKRLTDSAVRGRYRRHKRRLERQQYQKVNSRKEKEKTKDSGPPNVHKVEYNEFPDRVVITSKSGRIKTLDDLLEVGKPDLTRWKVRDYRLNAWEQHSVKKGLITLFQVRANLEKNRDAEFQDLFGELIEEMKKFAPTYDDVDFRPIKHGGFLCEPSIYDMHHNKQAVMSETNNVGNFKLSVEMFKGANAQLIHDVSPYDISRVVFPVGNDMFNADSLDGKTTRGTPQDNDLPLRDIVLPLVRAYTWAVDQWAKIAPVDVIVMPGNHDQTMAYMFGVMLWCWYNNTDRVTVDTRPIPRKYYEYGNNLIQFAHGDKTRSPDLVGLIPHEAKEAWARTTHRESHVGHLHTFETSRNVIKIDGTEIRGVRIRRIPSLTPDDCWHVNKGYLYNVKEAETLLWRPSGGVKHIISVDPNEIYRKRREENGAKTGV